MKTMHPLAAAIVALVIASSWPVARAYQLPPPGPSGIGSPSMPNGNRQPSAAASAPAASTPSPGSSSSAASSQGMSQGGAQASPCCGAPAPRMVERTICVPTFAWEKRVVPCVEFSTQQQQEMVTVMRPVPEKKTITRQYVVMVPETRTRTESYVVCKPVPCDSCNGCGCGGCKYVPETKQREVQYTVCVPQTKQCTYDVTVCNYVPEQRSVTVNVCVPHTAQKEVDVCVCHMVTKKVMVPVPTCCCMPCGCGPPCCGCGYGPCCAWESNCGWGPGCW
jgi:hypothetical protein